MNKNIIKSIIRTKYFDSLFKKRELISATIELTTCCNFKCVHCYNQDIPKVIMDKNLAFNLIDQMIDLGLQRITLTGGEPLSHPNFKEIYEYCYNKKLEVAIFTNGFLINKYLDLLTVKRPSKIEISLYGMNNETYKNVCKVENGFTQVFSNINLLISNNINLSLKTVIMMQNYHEYDEMVDFCKRLNLSFKPELSILKSKNFQNNQCDNMLNDSLYKNLFDKIKKDKLEIWKTNHAKEKIKENQNLIYNCGAGRMSIFVASNGNVSMCTFAKFSEKNIKNNSLKDIWESFNEYLVIEKDVKSECFNCKYKTFCTNCPVMSYLEHNTNGKVILPVEQNCREAKLIFECVENE